MTDTTVKTEVIEATSVEEAYGKLKDLFRPLAETQMLAIGPGINLHMLYVACPTGEEKVSKAVEQALETAQCEHGKVVRAKVEEIFESTVLTPEAKVSQLLTIGILAGILTQMLAGQKGPVDIQAIPIQDLEGIMPQGPKSKKKGDVLN